MAGIAATVHRSARRFCVLMRSPRSGRQHWSRDGTAEGRERWRRLHAYRKLTDDERGFGIFSAFGGRIHPQNEFG
jgi:hypothetical protein